MLELLNRTPFAAGLIPMWDAAGQEVALLVVKCTFEVGEGGEVGPASEQVPLCLADEYYGDPEKTSIRAGNDLALFKPSVDVIIVGSAHTPRGKAATRLRIKFAIGNIVRALRVWGDRTWEAGVLGYRASDPEPFTRMELRYERAYGGTDRKSADMRNPVGRGFRERDDGIAGSLLPNLEWEDAPLDDWRGRPEPAGVGFVAPSWQPRSRHSGTYDADWFEKRMPFLPDDFDYRHFQAASPRLTFPSLSAGELILLESTTPDGLFSFRLPECSLCAAYRHDLARSEMELRRDTVVIEPDAHRVILIHRAMIPCHRNHLALRQILVGDLTPGMKRAFLTGKKYWDLQTSQVVGLRT